MGVFHKLHGSGVILRHAVLSQKVQLPGFAVAAGLLRIRQSLFIALQSAAIILPDDFSVLIGEAHIVPCGELSLLGGVLAIVQSVHLPAGLFQKRRAVCLHPFGITEIRPQLGHLRGFFRLGSNQALFP